MKYVEAQVFVILRFVQKCSMQHEINSFIAVGNHSGFFSEENNSCWNLHDFFACKCQGNFLIIHDAHFFSFLYRYKAHGIVK